MTDRGEESALNMFKQMDLKGKAKDDTKLNTVHQNTINTIRVYADGPGGVTKFSCKCSFCITCVKYSNPFAASGVDGRVVVWNL